MHVKTVTIWFIVIVTVIAIIIVNAYMQSRHAFTCVLTRLLYAM